jgi:methyl-accepting chemotaxis protein
MQTAENFANPKKFISIKFKVTFLVSLLSLVSLAGISMLVFNSSRMQQISHDITGQYEDALTSNYFSKFDDFLNAIQASSGISQNLGETFYMLKSTLSREELAKTMENEYHKAFARETNLLGGGAFYEPNAFYPDVRDFHYFVSKELTAAGIPSENNVRWVGGEWAWDVDTYEEGWYQAALPKGWNRATPREKRYHWSELYVDTSVDALMVSVCIPIYSLKKFIVGVATVDVSLSTLQKMVSSFPLPTPSTQIVGFSTINNATFAISGNEKFDIVPYPEGSWLKGLEGIKSGQTVSRGIKLDGSDYSLTAYAHESGIGLAVLIPDLEKYAKVDALQTSNFITVIAIVLAMVAIIAVVLLAISSWIVKPVRQTFSMLETFAKGDLTQNISTSGRDELAQMMRMIDNTQKSIKRIIVAIGEKVQILHGSSNDLSSVSAQLANSANGTVAKSTEVASTAEQMAANINQMASGAKQASANANKVASTTEQMAANINAMASAAEQASANASEVASTTERMAANINAMANGAEQASTNASEVADTAEKMSSSMNTIAAAVEEMSASISQIAGNADEARKITEDAIAKSGDATKVMDKLGIAAKEIGKVTGVIKKIADKTNLLALNATIEAASAGEAGKGFAVVAVEIKELANQSASSADDIASKIESVQIDTGEAVAVINDVSGIIERINQSVEAIAGHVEQQTKASNEIANNVAQASTGAKRVASSIGEVARGTNEIANNVAQANEGAKRVASSIGEVARGTNEIASNVAQASTGAKQVASAIGEIAKGVNDVSRNANEAAKGATNVSSNTISMNQAAKESSLGASQVNQSSCDLAKIAEELKQTIAQFKV